ncbi:unnamed protein product [Phytomonas sp. Hart1]|nr:unnamed protein product [Phytomonas sp. Hart1]|eukprot:CCW67495.1 unnamed protein product [Phytomonas sp. isolate Hart1]
MPGGALVVPRSAQPPGADWKDSYFSLDMRYQQLRKLLNSKEEELKLLKVAQRKSKASFANKSSKSLNSLGPENPVGLNTSVPDRPSKTGTIRNKASESHVQEGDVLVPSGNYPKATSTTFIGDSVPMLGPASKLPDPAMIWGSEKNASNYVIATALYHANEELQSKLNESSTMIQSLQRELSSSRSLCTNFQARIEDLAQQIHQLIRERDLASQKLATSQESVTNLQRTLQNHIGEEQKLRFSLENQIADLRSRLIVGSDANDLLSKDVRALLSDTKTKDQQVMSLQSKLALTESALSSQRNTNENLLLELRGLNQQLVGERKRLLVAVGELELGQFRKGQIETLEAQLRQVKEERSRIELEHAKLLSEYAHSTEEALHIARQEVEGDLTDARRTAQQWENLSQLLYKDVAERTQHHQRCRAECEEAKTQRDMRSVELRQANEALKRCQAKLAVVWPNHDVDTDNLSAEEILETFKSRAISAFVRPHDEAGAATQLTTLLTGAAPKPPTPSALRLEKELPIDPTTTVDRIHELYEANAMLMAEVEQLRLANEMHLARIEAITSRHDKEKEHMDDEKRKIETCEVAGRALLARQLDRVQFLESQVRSLRGYHISPNATIESIPASETVLELFLGQLVAAEIPDGVTVPEDFSQVFCSVDFLLHETVTTPTVHGFNGFFDTTVSFRIAMDALLLYYLQTRQLLVQLHRIRSDDEVSSMLDAHDTEALEGLVSKGHDMDDPRGSTIARSDDDGLKMVERLFETVAEGYTGLVELVAREESLNAVRPTLKGHIKLIRSDNKHIASVEFLLTARTPFSEGFKELVRMTLTTPGGSLSPQRSAVPNREFTPSRATSPALPHATDYLTRQPVLIMGDPSGFSRDAEANNPPQAPRRGGLMQLIPANAETSATLAGSLPSSYDSSATAARFGTSSTDRTDLPRGRSPHNRRREDERIDLRPPQSSPGTGVKSDPSRARSRSVLPGVEDPGGDVGGFAHIAKHLLTSLSSAGPAAPGPDHRVRALAIDVVRVELPTDLPTPIPRLSCFFAVPCLGREVRLPAPACPQYTVAYALREGHPYGAVFAVTSLAQLARLAREPLTFVFLDEDAGGKGGVWAMALGECGEALGRPGVVRDYELPLWRPGGAAGEGPRTALRDAIVRVRVTAFAAAATAGEGDTGQSPVEVKGRTPPTPGLQPPSALATVRSLPIFSTERQQVSSFPNTTFSTNREGAGGDVGVGVPPSLEEELMRLEYEKHMSKR